MANLPFLTIGTVSYTHLTKGKEAQTVSVIEFLNDDISNYGASSLAGDMITQLGLSLIHISIKVVQTEDFILAKMDARLIVQVIINIVDNAIKYTPTGSTITISTTKRCV